MIKSALRTRTLQLADAVQSSRWDSSTGGEVDLHIGAVMDREWKRILNANAFYRVNRVTLTSDANGYFQLVNLTTGVGNAQKRLYRVISVGINNVIYEEVRIDQYLMPNTSVPQPQFVWYFEGNQILALPVTASSTGNFVVNWIPTRFDAISNENDDVDFPDGYVDIIAWSAASRLLNKSASEAARAQVLELQAEALRQDMLQDLMRLSLAPVTMRYADSTWDYGG